jgi:hypothetical protein
MSPSTTTWIVSSEVEEVVQGLEDAQTGLRHLEYAVEGMKDPPEALVEAVDPIRRALAGF